MTNPVILAITSDEKSLFDAVEAALRYHCEQTRTSRPVSVVSHVPPYNRCRDFRSLIFEARRRAEIARQKHAADAGIGTAHGEVELLCLKGARKACFRAFIAICVTDSGIFGYALSPTYPSEIEPDVAHAASTIINGLKLTEPVDNEIAIPAGIATMTFTRMEIEVPECRFRFFDSAEP